MKRLCLALLVGLLLSGCSALRTEPAAERDSDFHFVVMGDNRPKWNAEDVVTQNEDFIGNIERTNARQPDFAVIVGDLIHGYTDDADMIERQWDAYEEACRRFEVPFYSVIGNHDVWDEQSERIWRERYGPLYFSWDHRGCHFIALDSEVVGEMDRITGEQLRWLKQDLEAASEARRIFVFLHKPLWPQGNAAERNQWHTDVHPLLARHGVDTVFAGHHHRYGLEPERDGVRYVITGGAGAEIGPYRLAGDFFHLLDVEVSGASADWTVVTPEGEVAADCVTRESVAALGDALQVEPVTDVPDAGPIALSGTLTNPAAREAAAVVAWDTEGTSWTGEPARFAVPAAGEARFTLQARVGEPVFPLPEANLELSTPEEAIFAWNVSGKAFALLQRMGMVTEWNVVGPFAIGFADGPEADRNDLEAWNGATFEGWDSALPPEQKTDLHATYTGKDGNEIRWRKVEADPDGLVNLDAVFDGEDYAAACAVTYVHSPEGGTYRALVGSDDSILVRINGKEAFRHHVQRGPEPDQDAFIAELRPGWNEVFVKVAERWGGWGLYFRLMDPEGKLRFSASAPERLSVVTP
ncbi:MAG: metallophosphoesterase [Candidatus Brocadiaceae bacterium]|jgi:hypothetical protein